jgi:hypothetical protein
MNNKLHSETRVDAVLNSLDGATSAIPKPFLLTRINARLQAKQESIWDKSLYFISRPSIAFAAMCMVIAINIYALTYGDNTNTTLADDKQNLYTLVEDDITSNTLIFDNENIEP